MHGKIDPEERVMSDIAQVVADNATVNSVRLQILQAAFPGLDALAFKALTGSDPITGEPANPEDFVNATPAEISSAQSSAVQSSSGDTNCVLADFHRNGSITNTATFHKYGEASIADQFICPLDGNILLFTWNHRVFTTASVQLELFVNSISTAVLTHNLDAKSGVYTLPTSIAVSKGDEISLRTNKLSGTNPNDLTVSLLVKGV
jgi:hypothetical protein